MVYLFLPDSKLLLANSFVTFIFFFFPFFKINIQELSSGVVGLALIYARVLTGSFQWGVRQSAEVENLVSCLEFTWY